MKTAIGGKNRNVGISDIEDMPLESGEMIVRIYNGFGNAVMRGGYPAELREFRATDDSASLQISPMCSGAPQPAHGDPEAAWKVLERENIFTIRDSRTYPDYPNVRDGSIAVVQIRTPGTFREFMVSNPKFYDSPDNRRLLAILEDTQEEFSMAACVLAARQATDRP